MEEIKKITIPEFKELSQWLVWNYEYFGDEDVSSEDADEILRYFFGGTDA